MKIRILGLILLAGSSLFAATHVYIGVGGGYYRPPVVKRTPPPAPLVAYAPPAPGYGYTWVSGYWYPSGPRWLWRPGYWARPPYARAAWVGPRWHGNRYYPGYWRRR
jgi:hypothetical protein